MASVMDAVKMEMMGVFGGRAPLCSSGGRRWGGRWVNGDITRRRRRQGYRGLLSIAAGAGGGGGAGYSYANNGTCAPPVVVPATTYPAGDTTGAGQISINFPGGPCGTTPLTTVTGTIRAASAP